MTKGALAGLALLAASCAHAPPPPPSVAIEAPKAPASAPAVADLRFVVWTLSDGKPKSRLVSVGPRGATELGVADGAIFVWGQRAYRFVTQDSEVTLVDCDPTKNGAPLPEKGSLHRPALEELGRNERVVLDTDPVSEGMNELEQTAEIQASLGPYVFVTSHLASYSCGAHGSFDQWSLVWDLRSGKRTSIASAADVPREHEHARKALESSDRGWDDPLPLDDVTLVETLPTFAEGRFSLDLHFVASACYACSDGGWSAYTHSTIESAETLPTSIAPFAKPLPWLGPFLRSHEGETLGGVSPVERIEEIPGLAEAFPRAHS